MHHEILSYANNRIFSASKKGKEQYYMEFMPGSSYNLILICEVLEVSHFLWLMA